MIEPIGIKVDMTADEQTEWNYRFQERLGMQCGVSEPSPDQKDLARSEADAVVAILRAANEEIAKPGAEL